MGIKHSNKARSLTNEEEEVLWEAEKFGSKTPDQVLISSVCGGVWPRSLVSAAVKNTMQWKWKIFNSAKNVEGMEFV